MTTSESGIPSARLILPRRKYSLSTAPSEVAPSHCPTGIVDAEPFVSDRFTPPKHEVVSSTLVAVSIGSREYVRLLSWT